MKDCPLKGSLICRNANEKRSEIKCESCVFSQFSNEQIQKVLNQNKFIETLLPDSGISSLEESEKCLFCKGDAVDAKYLASLGLAHSEPAHTKSAFLGLGGPVRSPYGSLIQVRISCCSQCKRRIFIMRNIVITFTILGLLAGLIAANFAGGGLTGSGAGLLFIIACALLGTAVGVLLRQIYLNAKSPSMIVDLTEIELLRQIRNLGWRFYTGNMGKPYSNEKTALSSVSLMWHKK